MWLWFHGGYIYILYIIIDMAILMNDKRVGIDRAMIDSSHNDVWAVAATISKNVLK